jgi:ABC-type transport system involved in multi-copper enzyme maturation permease subunit
MTSLFTLRPAKSVAGGAVLAARPTFLGVLRGELFKLARQRLNRVLVPGVILVTLAPYLYALSYNAASAANHLQILKGIHDNPPLLLLLYFMGQPLAIQRVIVGIFLLVATARMVGLDYQNGTMRVLLARGVGRLQLLGAKLTVMALAGVMLFAVGIVLNVLGLVVVMRVLTGNLDIFKAATGQLWVAIRIDILTVLVSMGVTILLAAAAPVVTRSLSFGLAGALGWFAADNVIIIQLLALIYGFTNNDFWLKVSAYLLGPQLNVMPSVVAPVFTITGTIQGQVVSRLTPVPHLGTEPLISYDGRHTLMVTLVYAVIFAAAAIVPMWRREVLE